MLHLVVGRYAQLDLDVFSALSHDDEAEVQVLRPASFQYGCETGNWVGAQSLEEVASHKSMVFDKTTIAAVEKSTRSQLKLMDLMKDHRWVPGIGSPRGKGYTWGNAGGKSSQSKIVACLGRQSAAISSWIASGKSSLVVS